MTAQPCPACRRDTPCERINPVKSGHDAWLCSICGGAFHTPKGERT